MTSPSQLRQTHTVVQMGVPPNVFHWIKNKLTEHGYTHTFMPDGGIDMTGIALVEDIEEKPV